MSISIENKIALVTGANRGIGKKLAQNANDMEILANIIMADFYE